MGFVVLLGIIFILGIFSFFIRQISIGDFLISLMAFFFIVVISGFVNYTPDWEGYSVWAEYSIGNDSLFSTLLNWLKIYGFGEYKYVHILFSFLSAFFLVQFLEKFKINSFYAVILFMPILYLYYTTQIRFFLGFSFMVLALYHFNFSTSKKYLIFIILGILSHLSLVVFLPFFLLIKLDQKKFLNILVVSSFIFPVLFFILKPIMPIIFLERFNSYFLDENTPSFLGSLFKFAPSIFNGFFVIYFFRKFSKTEMGLNGNEEILFLYKMSIIPFTLLGLAFSFQVIGSRFIQPAIIFQVLFLLTLLKFYKPKKIWLLTHFLIVVNILLIYLFPFLFFGETYVGEETTKTFCSNSIIRVFI